MVKTAGSENLISKYYYNVRISLLKGATVEVPCFVVESWKDKVILGMSALQPLGVRLDCGQSRAYVKGNFDDKVAIAAEMMEVEWICEEVIPSPPPPGLQCLVEKWRDIFATVKGPTDKGVHYINIKPGTQPIYQRYYPVNPKIQQLIDKEVDDMLEAGFIEPCNSPWSNPVLLVNKAHSTEKRFCIDFRRLNEVTECDRYPLPNITALLEGLHGKTIFSRLDLRKGYWNIPLAPESRPLTSFRIPTKGQFMFKVLPFGLASAASNFERIMEQIFYPKMKSFVSLYLDDILIHSSTLEEHVQHLELVFQTLQEAKLIIGWDKCEFGLERVKFLGHIVSGSTIETDPEKVECIRSIPAPSNVKQIRQFLGMTGWYRKFVKDYAKIASPLNNLLKQGVDWTWGEKEEHAFQTLKETLTVSPVVATPDFSKEFTIETDASLLGLGACLTQWIDGKQRVIAFASRSLNKTERWWSATELECLAALFGITKFRRYVEGGRFTLITDHACLKWLHSMKNPKNHLAKMIVNLSQYRFDVIYRKGSLNKVPDCLSRMPNPFEKACENEEILPFEVHSCTVISDQDWDQVSDKFYVDLREKINTDPDSFPAYSVVNGKIYKILGDKKGNRTVMLVPEPFRKTLFEYYHSEPSAAHMGTRKVIDKLLQFYYWPKLRNDIGKWVRQCRTCQKIKVEQKAPMGFMQAKEGLPPPFAIISGDVIGPLPRSYQGNKYILVFLDTSTRWPIVVPLRSVGAKEVVRVLRERVIPQWGVPEVLILDNAKIFTGKVLKDFATANDIKLNFTPLYDPARNPTERLNRLVKTSIKMFVDEDHKSWDKYIGEISLALRNNISESSGFSPAQLNLGRQLRVPGEPYKRLDVEPPVTLNPKKHFDQLRSELLCSYNKAVEKVKEASKKQAHYYNLRRRPNNFSVGQWVLRKNQQLSSAVDDFAQKLSSTYVGPFVIKSQTAPNVFLLADSAGKDRGTWNVKDLKPFVE